MIYIGINRITHKRTQSDSLLGLLGKQWIGGMLTRWFFITKEKRKDCYSSATLFCKGEIIDIYEADHPDALKFLTPIKVPGCVSLQRLQNPKTKHVQLTDQTSDVSLQSECYHRRPAKPALSKAGKRKAGRNKVSPNKTNRPKGNRRVLKKAKTNS